MGGNRIEDIKQLIDRMFLCLHIGSLEELQSLVNRLAQQELASLSIDERIVLDNALAEMDRIAKEKKEEILQSLNDKENLKKGYLK